MKNTGGEGVLLLTRNPMKGFCPERPTGARDLSWYPAKGLYPSDHLSRAQSRDRELRISPPILRGISIPFTRRHEVRGIVMDPSFAFGRRSRAYATKRIRTARRRSASRNSSFVKAFPSFHPVGEEDVCLVRLRSVAVRGPNQFLAVGGEHREGIEIGMVGDPFLARSVFMDEVEVEVAPVLRIGHIGCKNDALSVRVPVRSKI